MGMNMQNLVEHYRKADKRKKIEADKRRKIQLRLIDYVMPLILEEYSQNPPRNYTWVEDDASNDIVGWRLVGLGKNTMDDEDYPDIEQYPTHALCLFPDGRIAIIAECIYNSPDQLICFIHADDADMFGPLFNSLIEVARQTLPRLGDLSCFLTKYWHQQWAIEDRTKFEKVLPPDD